MEILYTSIFVLRAWRLKTEDHRAFKKFVNLTAGDLQDIMVDFALMIEEIKEILRDQFKIDDIESEDIAKIFNIKQLNSSSLEKIGKKGSALYANYPLMNSHCFSNTRYTIGADMKLTGITGKKSGLRGYLRSNADYFFSCQYQADSERGGDNNKICLGL